MTKIGLYKTLGFLTLMMVIHSSFGQFMDFELKLKSNSKLQAVEINSDLSSDFIYVPEDLVYFWVKLSNYKNFDLYFEVIYKDEFKQDHLPALVKVYDQRKEIYEAEFNSYFDIRPISKFLFDEEIFKKNPRRYETYFGFPIRHTSQVNLVYN